MPEPQPPPAPDTAPPPTAGATLPRVAGSGSRPGWLATVRASPGTFSIVALQVAAFAWVAVAFGLDPSLDALVRAGALERGHVWRGEWWRLGSAVFLHGSVLHLAANTLFGLSWCRLVERVAGTRRFLFLYAVSGLAGSAASLLAWDVVSVGASGALFGMIGATLVFHRRALPTWRAFLTSRVTVSVTLQLAAWTAVAVAGALPVKLDHAAHGGGLAAGAACAWLLTSRTRRPAAWGALGAVLLALVVAAAWPRAGLTAFGAAELERSVYWALRAKDQEQAAALLRRADDAGLKGDALAYYRGLLEVQRGQLEAAVALLQPVARGGEPAEVRKEARRALAGVTRRLGYQRYTGDGAPQDAEAGLRWFEASCEAGEAESCRDVKRIRGLAPP